MSMPPKMADERASSDRMNSAYFEWSGLLPYVHEHQLGLAVAIVSTRGMRVVVFSVRRESIETYDTSSPKLTCTPRRLPASSSAASTRSDEEPSSRR